jgi:hypothetical protein
VLSPFCGREDCPNIETVLDRLLLANAPDFINDGIPYHDLFSHEFFRRADDRTFTPMLTSLGSPSLDRYGDLHLRWLEEDFATAIRVATPVGAPTRRPQPTQSAMSSGYTSRTIETR